MRDEIIKIKKNKKKYLFRPAGQKKVLYSDDLHMLRHTKQLVSFLCKILNLIRLIYTLY